VPGDPPAVVSGATAATAPLLAGGHVASTLAAVVLALLILAAVLRMRRGRPLPKLRPLPALEALDEAVGRAAEMGRPVHMTPGPGSITSPEVLASFPVLAHLARTAARCDARLIETNADVVVQALSEEVMRQGYLKGGRPHRFRSEDVRFLSESQFAYAAGVMGLFRRERPAASVLWGMFNAEAMVLVEAGAEVGALQVAGTTNTYQLPFFVAGCDQTLIGEELYAASAYLARDPVLVGTVVAQDWARLGILALLVAGLVLSNLGPWGAVLAGWLHR
jgi:hypothetical protein